MPFLSHYYFIRIHIGYIKGAKQTIFDPIKFKTKTRRLVILRDLANDALRYFYARPGTVRLMTRRSLPFNILREYFENKNKKHELKITNGSLIIKYPRRRRDDVN